MQGPLPGFTRVLAGLPLALLAEPLLDDLLDERAHSLEPLAGFAVVNLGVPPSS